MALHFVHWKVAGKTLAPLELNEVMYTLELGIVTAGFLFMTIAVIATAIFGRFFCSWGCHILALQDLSAWILRKLRIKPRPIRSRLLLWVPVIAALYMFVWPQMSRVTAGRPMASLHLATDADGWASFVTQNYWRNLPSPGVTTVTFLVCGFLIVYVLGTRSFCTYGCPYGAVFGLVDRVAPGRIRAGPDCTQCATCTSVCTSHVRVHEELERYGMVVNPSCLKDLDCVAACPQQSVHYGFGRPSLLRCVVGTTEVKRLFELSAWEELLAAAVFVVVLVTYRGLYDLAPFLLSLALGAVLAYGAILSVRLFRRRTVVLNRLPLRRAGSLTGWGVAFCAMMLLIGALTMHSAVVRYSAFQGERLYGAVAHLPERSVEQADRAIVHLARAQSWGLIPIDRFDRMRADLYAGRRRWPEAEALYRRLVERSPRDVRLRQQLAAVLTNQDRFDAANRELLYALELDAGSAETHYGLAGLCFRTGSLDRAEHHLRGALLLRPDHSRAHYDLGALLVERGALDAGIAHLRECVRLDPRFGDGYYNLAVALASRGALDAAAEEIERAVALQPEDEQTNRFRAYLGSLMQDHRSMAEP